ncbi:DUF3007 family protein [Capilliphycus salinus ALCB114379]|uniref:DUF3007 family protein n=1 Tax=Capilliphycus salinus TaxID=2768948 RepID=UPI0039A582BA
MRRIDAIGIGIGVFAAGGVAYLILQAIGLESADAGIWSQVLLVAALVGWLLSYLFRALTQNMTLNQQVKDYEDAVLQKRLEEMTPEELAQLQAEVEQEKQTRQKTADN